ncbi:MAG: DNA-binding transcriptional regulator, partial [bacterium]|nr:DNA-binding transcriptional regulator [bacterium]
NWGKEILEGVARFSRQLEEPWLFFVEPRGKYEKFMLPEDWTGDGVIARVTHSALAEQLMRKQLPTVNVSWYNYGGPTIVRCTADEKRAGMIAAEHFLERGFRRFAYCGSPRRPNYVDRFGAAFVNSLQEQGYECTTYQPTYLDDGKDWEKQLAGLGDWLVDLPRPSALLTFDGITGRQVAEACGYRNLRVPEDVAILGGENDDLFSQLSNPPLSTVDLNAREVGRTAARLLWDMLRGETPPSETTYTPVKRVITRQSTDILAVEDDAVRTAVKYIRENCRNQIQVVDLVRATNVSRRSLEQRFRDILGRSPAAEIRRTRIEVARNLLVDTDLSMSQVAARSGMEGAEMLARIFRRELDMTPTQYRAKNGDT